MELLSKRNETVAVAESCTGGYLASTITDVSGSSAVFLEGNVTYSNDAKIRTLNVPATANPTLGSSQRRSCPCNGGRCSNSIGSYLWAFYHWRSRANRWNERKAGWNGICWVCLRNGSTEVLKLFYPTDRLTFKQAVTQQALDLLRKRYVVVRARFSVSRFLDQIGFYIPTTEGASLATPGNPIIFVFAKESSQSTYNRRFTYRHALRAWQLPGVASDAPSVVKGSVRAKG